MCFWPEVVKTSDWSPWQPATVVNGNGLFREDSVQCICQAEVNESYLLRRPRLRVKSRYCMTHDWSDSGTRSDGGTQSMDRMCRTSNTKFVGFIITVYDDMGAE